MTEEQPLRIAETSTSIWSYHLVRATTPEVKQGQLQAICGKEFVGWDSGPVEAWGKQSHLPSIWCAECTKEQQTMSRDQGDVS